MAAPPPGVEIFSAPDGERRVKDQELLLPVVSGTVAFWLGKKASEYNSHKWTVYLRGAGNQDITPWVSKVIFHLHPSFTNPNRTVDSPPFELTETGWGEFEIVIQVHFKEDAKSPPLELYHPLKLYSETDGQQNQVTKKPVVHEKYDEIVFSEPPEAFYTRVTGTPTTQAPPSTLAPYFQAHSAKEELARIQAARLKAAQFKAALLRQLEASS
mmetsp:Transcript_25709/g.45768  ORF Transcript_25709/g.45768 Transcript_25709/m.45768 type:complete len:213 (-) Transcript_25709:333-971(-)|eukprot:CAMPEP_0177762044 /NCGR_PEP_ID=MMETSP0491_2-20121128/6131_1 /TAXON_ID=63592 /ORGANISM="Tetraselmis chuii, Strain PLY429" /LENGTH=212 /DNA_ID=CAMNT_0019278065 /DNA_START=329 /DNA_END=967 /DNA_ORIENTATION=+